MPSHDRPIIVVRNPNSTSHVRVEQEVLSPLVREGIRFDTYDTQYPDAASNIAAMTRDLPERATVLSAAGDGTSNQVTNAALADKDWQIGYLPYGNFNDLANAHMNRRQNVLDVVHAPTITTHPLAIDINGVHQRYVPGYITLGMVSLIAAEFSKNGSRNELRDTSRTLRLAKSLSQAANDYWRFRHNVLPAFRANGGELQTHTTDIAIANTPIIASVIRTAEPYYNASYFGARTDLNMANIWQATSFGTRALTGHTPLRTMRALQLDFEQAVTVPIQTDGEPLVYPDARRIFVYKDPTVHVDVLHAK